MKATDLALYESGATTQVVGAVRAMPLDEVVAAGVGAVLKRHAFRYRDVCIRTLDLALLRKPLNKAVLLRLLARRRCWLEDEQGVVRTITIVQLLVLAVRRIRDYVTAKWAVRGFLRRIAALENEAARQRPLKRGAGPVLYVRADLVGVKSGGSITHIAGVLNNLLALLGDIRFFTTAPIPMVDAAIKAELVRPDLRYADTPEIRSSLFSESMAEAISLDWHEAPPQFVYQRYAVNNVTGLLLALRFRVPLIIEYNGSEVWINRHWGKALAHEGLALRLERLNLAAADLVVVVSKVLADELIERGIPPERILVNPNGVDPELYRPDIDGSSLRTQLCLADRQVIGFIGTFGPWHGAEVLARAAGRLLLEQPRLREKIAFLFIGDGQAMPKVRQIVTAEGIADCCHFTGLVPQNEAPRYMAACHILISPHVPNPDGSRFFGSPTKLFEYMAMGRPIVASALEQISELLTDDRDAVLVPPGDVGALADAIRELVANPKRCGRLGAAARQTAEQHFTWRRHTERILAALEARVAAMSPGGSEAA